MGYYTDYRLSATDKKNQLVDLDRDLLEKITGYTWKNRDGEVGLDQVKWYEHQDDMQILTDRLPALRLELFCDGEDGDQWIVYAKGGKVLVCRSTRVFEPNTLWTDNPEKEA